MVFRIFPTLREGLGYLSAEAAAAFERG